MSAATKDEQSVAEGAGIVEADLLAPMDVQIQRFRDHLRRELAAHLAAGYPVYSGGTGPEAGMLIVHMPDGRRYEYRVREDSTREIVRELSR
jgi:hypothetical protein